MKTITIIGLVALFSVGIGASAATWGDQFIRANLWAVIEGDSASTRVYKVDDTANGATCYIGRWSDTGVSLSCVK